MAFLLFGCCGIFMMHAAEVRELSVPDQGIQPRAIAGADGVLHLVWYRGEATGGDLFYSRQTSAGDKSEPVRVNSTPQSAVSIGTIRGAQAVLGKAGRMHAVWNGARPKDAKKDDRPPLFYSRLSDAGNAFEDQRPMSGDWIMDGGGTVAADHHGHVYVFWHGGNGTGEGGRRILVRCSEDDGKTFEAERAISPEGLGVCACCAMQALAVDDGGVYVLYRTANDGGKNRDIMLLTSHDGGKSFNHRLLDRWPVNACPMTSMSLANTKRGVVGTWETQGKIRVAFLGSGFISENMLTLADSGAKPCKYPTLAVGSDGRILVAWSEGAGWQKSGLLAWQIFDGDLKPVTTQTRDFSASIPVWSFPCALAQGNCFLICR